MILCLDIGNTQLFAGVYQNDQICLRFRHDSKTANTSDQLGVFLKSVLRENAVNPKHIQQIAVSSVVPSLDYSIRAACRKYFNLEPSFLTAQTEMDLKILTQHPEEVGADLLATAIAAITQYPQKNILIADFGTATTFSAINAAKEYLGTIILAGMRLSMQALGTHAAKLFPVEIIKPDHVVGRNTIESIQSGLYYGHLGIVREMIHLITHEVFSNHPPIILGTGGFVHMFEKENIFTHIVPDLVLEGIRIASSKKHHEVH